MWKQSINFESGEIGSRLDSNRDNDIFSNSAKKIHNMIVTPMGTLRCMKTWNETTLDIGNIVEVLNTRYDFYIVIGTNKMATIRRSDNTLITEFSFNTLSTCTCSIFANTRFATVNKGYNIFYEFDESGTNIQVIDYMSMIEPPLLNRSSAIFDVHRVYEIEEVEGIASDTGDYIKTKKKVLEKIGDSLRDPVITLDASGNMIIEEIGGNVVRIYEERLNIFRPVYADDDPEDGGDITMDELNYGDLIINFHGGFPTDLLWQTNLLSFTDSEVDQSLTYWKSTDGVAGTDRLYRGTVIDLTNTLTAVTTFQNRLVFLTDEVIYFSKVNQYLDFTNYIEDNSAFYVKPNPINNQQPNLLNAYSSRSLYITTDKGLYQINYNTVITAKNIDIRVVADVPATKELNMIDSTLFFKGVDGNLYALQESEVQNDNTLYYYVVEKYDLYSSLDRISVVMFDKHKRLICTTSDPNIMHMYLILGNNDFQRVSFDLQYPIGSKVYGVGANLVTDGKLYTRTNINYTDLSVKIHQPSLFNDESGTLLNDYNSIIKVMNCNIVNDDGEQIELVKMGGSKCSNIGSKGELQTLYTVKINQKVSTGVDVLITTSGSDGVVELTAVEYMYESAGRY